MDFVKSLALIAVSVQALGEYPGDLCCRLYAAANYGDPHINLCYKPGGSHIENTDLSPLGFSNQISSYWCGKNVSYDFCRNPTGPCYGSSAISGAG